ncbi:MAG: hypothetical protein ACYTFI_08530 [Planctomycetota bacterium]|jgi:hypothetical protein
MTDERERVERLVREGKVSEEEGRKLIAALDDAERREARPGTPEEVAGPAEARGGSAAKRPGIFSRPAGWFLMGLAVILIGVTVQSFVTGRVITRTLPGAVGESVDEDTFSKHIGEVASGLEGARLWGMPFYVLGGLLMVISIVKWIVKLAAEARGGR